MKRYVLSFFLFFLSIYSINAQEIPSLSIINSTVEYGIAQTNICISFQNNTMVTAFQCDITYDNTVLNAADVKLDTTVNSHHIVSNEISPGVHRILVYSLSNESITAPIEILLPVSILTTGTQTTVTLGNVVLSDNTATSVTPASIANGTITLLAADSDNDGIPDSWEKSFFDDIETMNKTSDYDNDGFKDLFEYQADTDPTDPNSLLKISAIQTEETLSGEEGIKITWYCQQGKSYKIFWCDSVPGSVWDEVSYEGLENDIIMDTDTQSWTDEGKDPHMGGQMPSSTNSRLYKVTVIVE